MKGESFSTYYQRLPLPSPQPQRSVYTAEGGFPASDHGCVPKKPQEEADPGDPYSFPIIKVKADKIGNCLEKKLHNKAWEKRVTADDREAGHTVLPHQLEQGQHQECRGSWPTALQHTNMEGGRSLLLSGDNVSKGLGSYIV